MYKISFIKMIMVLLLIKVMIPTMIMFFNDGFGCQTHCNTDSKGFFNVVGLEETVAVEEALKRF